MSSSTSNVQRVWRLVIPMVDEIKRPYSPSIEVFTRKGEQIAEREAPARLSVILRSLARFCYGVTGLRLPKGVDRFNIVCTWDQEAQACVLVAPFHDAASDADAGGLLTGVELREGGFMGTRFKQNPSMPLTHAITYSADQDAFFAGVPSNQEQVMQAMFSRGRAVDVAWSINQLNMSDIVLPYEVLDKAPARKGGDSSAAADDDDSGAHKKKVLGAYEYEEQYKIRDPLIKVHHDKATNDDGEVPNPTAENPFGEEN